jgi:hypothetical protein
MEVVTRIASKIILIYGKITFNNNISVTPCYAPLCNTLLLTVFSIPKLIDISCAPCKLEHQTITLGAGTVSQENECIPI